MLYQVQNPLVRAQGLSGNATAKFQTAIQGKQRDAALQPPEKTAGGAIASAASGAVGGASLGSSIATGLQMGGTAGGLWGAGIGALVGLTAYALG